MDRRQWLASAGAIATAAGLGRLMGSAAQPAPAAQPVQPDPAAPQVVGDSKLRITDVRAILTQPASAKLVVVKVFTNEPGLYGLGCATFTQRARVVETAVDKFLRPFLIGKDPSRIEDIRNSCHVSSYWRNGPVLNNAISGVDMALWDILGKRAGLPVYQLFGGKCREAVDTYAHTSGTNFQECEAAVARAKEKGYRHIRIQLAMPGLSTYGAGGAREDESKPANARTRTWEPGPYVRALPKLFEHMRKVFGDDIELLHDMHERVPPILAIKAVKDLEQFRPFFIEDPFSPEDIGWFEILRRQTATPLAMGELFNSPHEWIPLVKNRLIDFIRVHMSQMGGLSPCRKMAAMCEHFNVRTAWHGPGDVSPVGHAANLHLDLTVANFGIQESREFTPAEREVFPGSPEIRNGWFYVNEKPGLGVDLDEKAAAKFPFKDDPPFDMGWGNTRRRDGTVVTP